VTTELGELGRRITEETGHYSGGPLPVFEEVGRHTFQTLVAGGLLPYHKFLDFGCGSLRNGYWFMRFLDAGNYYGIEPVEKGVRAGLKHLIGPELEAFKKPQFIFNDESDISAFGVPFDYVMARSIVTHTCPGMLRKMLKTFAESCPDGVMYASYWRLDLPKAPTFLSRNSERNKYQNMAVSDKGLGPNQIYVHGDDLPDDDMRFVEIIRYSFGYIENLAAEYGLSVEEDWTYPPVSKQIWLKFRVK